MWAGLLSNAALPLAVDLGALLARLEKISELVYKFLSRFSLSFNLYRNRVVNMGPKIEIRRSIRFISDIRCLRDRKRYQKKILFLNIVF